MSIYDDTELVRIKFANIDRLHKILMGTMNQGKEEKFLGKNMETYEKIERYMFYYFVKSLANLPELKRDFLSFMMLLGDDNDLYEEKLLNEFQLNTLKAFDGFPMGIFEFFNFKAYEIKKNKECANYERMREIIKNYNVFCENMDKIEKRVDEITNDSLDKRLSALEKKINY